MSALFLLSSGLIKTYAIAGALGADVDLYADSATLGNNTTPKHCRIIRVGVAGDLKILTASGTTDTVYGVLVGETVIVEGSKIFATGTSAQKITVFW